MVLKRKISSHLVCIDSKKINAVPKKPQTKPELIKEIKSLQKLNEALEEENKSNLCRISELEEKVKSLSTSSVPCETAECQTFTEKIQIPCNLCTHVATCEEELNWHMGEEHDRSSESYFDTDYPCDICGKWCRSASDLIHHQKRHDIGTKSHESHRLLDMIFSCNFCDEKFETRRSLMIHNKKEHAKNVNMCWNFSAGKCDHGDDCWFIHGERKAEQLKIECNICRKFFVNMNDLFHHRKSEHQTKVQKCKNKNSNACPYGEQGCWFVHDIATNNAENKDVTEEIVRMMETFTQRIMNLESQMKV